MGYMCLTLSVRRQRKHHPAQHRSASSARRYESSPKPHITPLHTGDIYEWRRNSSRLCTLEICTSMTGHFNERLQSCRAMLVCVYAPAFSMMPSYEKPVSCMMFISSPSMLL